MGQYLVMKNNLRRILSRKSTYLCLFGIPILIVLLSAVTNSITDNKVRIGLLGTKEEMGEAAAIFADYPVAVYEEADRNSLKTDLITKKYELIVDCAKEESVNQAVSIIESRGDDNGQKTGLSDSDRMVATAVTIYMVAASIFMAKICSDRKKGLIVRFAYAGNNKTAYFGGTMLSTFFLIAIGMMISVGTAASVTGDGRYSVLGVVGISLAASLLITLVAGVFVLLGRSEFRANIMVSSYAAVASLLGGTFVAVSSMPPVIRFISIVSPVRLVLFLVERL